MKIGLPNIARAYLPVERLRHRDVVKKHKRTRTLSTEEHARPDEVAVALAKDSPEVYLLLLSLLSPPPPPIPIAAHFLSTDS